MDAINTDMKLIQSRDFSSAFSRSAFIDVLNYNDYSHFNWLISKHKKLKSSTYFDLLTNLYDYMSNNYRCEYVYKNELIKYLLNKYETKNSVYFSEFRVGNSIADMALFNGNSKVFEIKTEYDTPRRLDKQMEDYKRLFDECFLVIPKNKYEEYHNIMEPTTGIILMIKKRDRIHLEEVQSAEQNCCFDAKVLMSCLRTEEYKNIASSLGASIEGISKYDLFTYCRDVILKADAHLLRTYFLQEVKKRKNNASLLLKCPPLLRQMILSLNLPRKKADILLEQLNININQA